MAAKKQDQRRNAERRLLREAIRRTEAPTRWVIEMALEVEGARTPLRSYYSATDGVFTNERANVTLFLERAHAEAIRAALGPRFNVVRCSTRLVKGVRLATSLKGLQ
ncbi:MAG: hypothetical protein ACOZQL_18775 [Myxococcota bacterium]